LALASEIKSHCRSKCNGEAQNALAEKWLRVLMTAAMKEQRGETKEQKKKQQQTKKRKQKKRPNNDGGLAACRTFKHILYLPVGATAHCLWIKSR
jgi:hypothetical protein